MQTVRHCIFIIHIFTLITSSFRVSLRLSGSTWKLNSKFLVFIYSQVENQQEAFWGKKKTSKSSRRILAILRGFKAYGSIQQEMIFSSVSFISTVSQCLSGNKLMMKNTLEYCCYVLPSQNSIGISSHQLGTRVRWYLSYSLRQVSDGAFMSFLFNSWAWTASLELCTSQLHIISISLFFASRLFLPYHFLLGMLSMTTVSDNTGLLQM